MHTQTIDAEYHILGIGSFLVEAEVDIATERFVDDAAPGSYFRQRGEEVTDATLSKATFGGVLQYLDRKAVVDFAGETLAADLEARAINAFADGKPMKTSDDMVRPDMLALDNAEFVPAADLVKRIAQMKHKRPMELTPVSAIPSVESVVIFLACVALAGIVVAIGLSDL